MAEREPGAHVRNLHSSESLHRVQTLSFLTDSFHFWSKVQSGLQEVPNCEMRAVTYGSAAPDEKHEKNVVFNSLIFVKESKTIGEQVAALMLHIKHFKTGA